MDKAEELKKRIIESQKIPRFPTDIQKNANIEEIIKRNELIREIIDHHSAYPFQQASLTCKESLEARNFFLQILSSINFSSLVKEVSKELLKIGEAILAFEGRWKPPQILNPASITVALPGNNEEHIEYRMDDEICEMVINTPKDEQSSLLKLLDPYTIRQVELGRHVDLTRSPFIKVLHPRRRTATKPDARRGVPYFEPILAQLIEAENIKTKILNGSQEYFSAVNKIKEAEVLAFEYSFPRDLRILEAEFKYLQDIVRYMLVEEIFKPAAMARNLANQNGIILPKLHFLEIKLADNKNFQQNIQELRTKLKIDVTPGSLNEFKKQYEMRN